jgi:Tol biopolymer transport system component
MTLILLLSLYLADESTQREMPPGFIPPPVAEKLESKYFTNPKQLTTVGRCGEAYFSPDGKSIIFQSVRGDHPFYQIYIKDLATGEERLVSTGEGRTTCSFFHPVGNKIMYASSHLDPQRQSIAQAEILRLTEQKKNPQHRTGYTWDFDPHMDIFEAKPDGSGLVRLTDAPGYDAEGAYSPDGSQIVFSSFRKGAGDIYIMNADGSNVRQLTDSPGYDGGPFFSPDGKRIIFRGEIRKRDHLQVFVINVDGTGERQLTDESTDGAVNWCPYWHPDGQRVIWASSKNGHYNYDLFLMNVDTGEKKQVTYMFGADVLPVFSPDGKRLLWTSKRGKDSAGVPESEIWIADWNQ